MAVLIIVHTTSAASLISSNKHCTLWVFFLLRVPFIGLSYHLTLPSFPWFHFTSLLEGLDSPHSFDANPHQMANMDDARRSDVPMKKCAVCQCQYQEKGPSIMTAPCGHTYCCGCVNKLCDRAAKHEINFPPKCCGQVITLEDLEWFLTWEIYNKFQEKSEEFSTTNRTYCSNHECATFISPKAIDDDKAKCPAYQKLTCTVCKAGAHEGDCLEDPTIQSLMTAAAEADFQQCRKCKRIIELNEGCYHIT